MADDHATVSYPSIDIKPLTGSVAVVTGAAKRLGKEIALSLARELELDVVVHCGKSEDEAALVSSEIRKLGCRSVVVSADLSCPRSAAEKIFAAAKSIGQIRVLINCAAVFDDVSLQNIDTKHCEQHFAINTLAPLFLAQQLAGQLHELETGHIINMLDWRAQRPPETHLVYTATKAALVSITKGLAQQLAPRIQVNAIAPGAILPPADRSDWHAVRAGESIPLQRSGQPSDVCEAIVFLLRSKFITGEIIHVSGGEEL